MTDREQDPISNLKLLPALLVLLFIIFAIPIFGHSDTGNDQSDMEQNNSFRINADKVDLKAFIKSVSAIAEVNIIFDKNVQGTASIVSNVPIEKKYALDLIESMLDVNGYALDKDGDMYRVVPMAKSNLALHLGLAKSSHGVTAYVFKPHNTKPSLIANALSSVLSNTTKMKAIDSKGILIITGTPSALKDVNKFINILDNADHSSVAVYKLKYISSRQAVKTILSLYPSIRTRTIGYHTVMVSGNPDLVSHVTVILEKMDRKSSASYKPSPIFIKTLHNITSKEAKSAIESLHILSDDATLSIDELRNVISVSGNNDDKLIVEAYLNQIDVQRKQILVEAIILEVSGDESLDLGVAFSRTTPKLSVGVAPGKVAQPLNDTLAALTAKMFSNNPLALGALARLVSTNSKIRVLSKPKLLVLDNEKANIMVGQNIPFITSSTAGAAGVQPFQTIERHDVGLQLNIKPRIRDNSIISMQLRQEVSSVAPSAATATDIITNKRVIDTNILMTSGEVAVMGGLLEHKHIKTEDGIPLLMDIPVLGNLFKHSIDSNTNTNLVLFIKATVLDTPESLRTLKVFTPLEVKTFKLDSSKGDR